jgi:hypothetical protein
MIRAPFASALALAAFLAVPAFAQTDSNSTSVNGATVAPLEKNAAKQSAAEPSKQVKADSTTTSTTSASEDVNSSSVDGAHVAPLEKNAAKQSASASHKQSKADKTASSTTANAVDCNSTTVDGAHVAPLEKNSAKQQASADGTSSGKLVDCVSDKPVTAKKKKSTKTASNTPK